MTTTRRGAWVRLDALTDEQLAILREELNDWLVGKADDLPRDIDDSDGVKREVEEVAALGRLVSGMRRGEVLMPDPIARGADRPDHERKPPPRRSQRGIRSGAGRA